MHVLNVSMRLEMHPIQTACSVLVVATLASACVPALFTSNLGIHCSNIKGVNLTRNELEGQWNAVEIFTLGIGTGISLFIPRNMCMIMEIKLLDNGRLQHASLDVNATTGEYEEFVSSVILTEEAENGKFTNETEHLEGIVIAEVDKKYIVVGKCGPVLENEVPVLWSLTIYRSTKATRDLTTQELQNLRETVKNKLKLHYEQAQTHSFGERCHHYKLLQHL